MKKILLILSVVLLSVSLQGQMIIRANSNARVMAVADTLGAEMISNGVFTDGTDWTANTGWAIGSGVATYDDVTNNALLLQVNADMISAITATTTYRLEFDITISSGNAFFSINNSSGTVAYKTLNTYSNGHKVVRFTTTAVTIAGISFWGNIGSTTSFTIDNISLKKVL